LILFDFAGASGEASESCGRCRLAQRITAISALPKPILVALFERSDGLERFEGASFVVRWDESRDLLRAGISPETIIALYSSLRRRGKKKIVFHGVVFLERPP
jgi:hypothetical protein